MIQVPVDEARSRSTRLLVSVGLSVEDAERITDLLVTSSMEGVPSHGLHFLPAIQDGLRSGRIDAHARMECVGSFGAWEQWDGNQAPGPLTALDATDRALAIASENGLGLVAVRNTNHWTRPANYAARAARRGFGFICWANTPAVMPPLGSTRPRLGNNPIVFAHPGTEANGAAPIVLDMALAQFSIGRLQTTQAAGERLPVPGGFDADGQLTDDPGAILSSGRSLPIGHWKGAGLALLLDLLGATLSGGNTTKVRTEEAPHDSVCHVFLALDLGGRLGGDAIALLAREVIEDLRHHVAEEGARFRYPGEGARDRRRENLRLGVPVNEAVWSRIVAESDAVGSVDG